MTILANEVIITGPIGPAINIWLARKGQLMIPCMQGIISWPYWTRQIFIGGPIGPVIITSLAKIVLTLLRSFEHPGPVTPCIYSFEMFIETHIIKIFPIWYT